MCQAAGPDRAPKDAKIDTDMDTDMTGKHEQAESKQPTDESWRERDRESARAGWKEYVDGQGEGRGETEDAH